MEAEAPLLELAESLGDPPGDSFGDSLGDSLGESLGESLLAITATWPAAASATAATPSRRGKG